MWETHVQSLGWEDSLENPIDREAWVAIVHGGGKELDPPPWTERLTFTLTRV